MHAPLGRLPALGAALLTGCGEGPMDETLVDELRVLGIRAEPPEAAPGEPVALTALVADPAGTGADVLLWHCTDLGDGCLEPEGTNTWTATLDGDEVTAAATVPEALAPFAGAEPLRATVLWALACEPGLCPPVEDPAAWDLSDPGAWLVDLPLEGVSLAFSTFAVSSRETRAANPVLAHEGPEPIVAGPGATVELPFSASLDAPATADTLLFGFATAGGFGQIEWVVGDDGAVAPTWYAPEEPGSARLYVVLQDGEGGVDWWVGEAEVE